MKILVQTILQFNFSTAFTKYFIFSLFLDVKSRAAMELLPLCLPGKDKSANAAKHLIEYREVKHFIFLISSLYVEYIF